MTTDTDNMQTPETIHAQPAPRNARNYAFTLYGPAVGAMGAAPLADVFHEETARRLAAAWNICKGRDLAELESGAVGLVRVRYGDWSNTAAPAVAAAVVDSRGGVLDPEGSPVVVIQRNGGLINVVTVDRPARVIFLDDDTEGGDEANIRKIEGEEVYVIDAAIVLDDPGDWTVDPDFCVRIVRELDEQIGNDENGPRCHRCEAHAVTSGELCPSCQRDDETGGEEIENFEQRVAYYVSDHGLDSASAAAMVRRDHQIGLDAIRSNETGDDDGDGDDVGRFIEEQDTQKEAIARAVEAAMNAGALVIQQCLGVTTGDTAAQFFDGSEEPGNKLREVFSEYFAFERERIETGPLPAIGDDFTPPRSSLTLMQMPADLARFGYRLETGENEHGKPGRFWYSLCRDADTETGDDWARAELAILEARHHCAAELARGADAFKA